MAIEAPLIAIRERSLIDLFDLGLAVVRRRPLPLVAATVLGVAPFFLFNLWIFSTYQTRGLSVILWWVEAPVALSPLTATLGLMMFDRPVRTWGVCKTVLRSSWSLLVTHGLLRFIPLYWIPTRVAFGNEIILLERGGAARIWRRGGDLVGNRDGELVLFGLANALMPLLFTALIYLGTFRLVQAAVAREMTWDTPEGHVLFSVFVQVPIWLVAAYFTLVRFLVYIDQRIRLEGWETTLRLRAVGEAMAESQRWD